MAAVCSVATVNYLPGLVALYRSILAHQDIPLYLMLADLDPDEIAPIADAVRALLPEHGRDRFHALGPTEVFGAATGRMRFYYDAFEFATACKAAMHVWMQRHTEVERWLYLDSDMLCCAPLDPILAELDGYNLLLTPHRDRPAASAAADLNLLGNGVFNSGMLGVRRSPVSAAFTDWYLKVLTRYCLNDTTLPKSWQLECNTVLAADQRWLDLTPAYFAGVRIAKQRGFNLGHWNIDGDRLDYRDGRLYIGPDPVVMLHLSGWSPGEPSRFTRHSDVDWSADPAWIRIHGQYRDEIVPLVSRFARPYRYATFADGSMIDRRDRRHYLAEVLADIAPEGDPFEQPARFRARRPARKRKWRQALRRFLALDRPD
ncbi:MAG: hypothetical protein HGA75_02915 [Thiobacillus sp.]|nr:hypothetical protein [Thiobacillus sp.]